MALQLAVMSRLALVLSMARRVAVMLPPVTLQAVRVLAEVKERPPSKERLRILRGATL